MSEALTLDAVEAAAERLDGIARRTPLTLLADLVPGLDGEVLLKLENLQRGGAFKLRGAYNAIASLSPAERAGGVFAYSSGNHAQGVAIAARLLGTTATILMPTDAPPEKVAGTRRHGADVVTYDRYTEDRDALAREHAERRGAVLIPPFDHLGVMAGQGTVAHEVFEDTTAPVDTLVVPVGGGGLLGGCTVATPLGVRLVGVEPAERPAGRRGLEADGPVVVDVPRTIADGQQTPYVGRRPLTAMRGRVDAIVGVTDAQIAAAMRRLWEGARLLVEPSGASAFAAVLADPRSYPGRTVVVLSGGNITPDRFDLVVTREAVPPPT